MSSPATTWLFVPGDRPDRFARAANSGTDQVIYDLEDAVLPQDKDRARDQVRRWIASGGSGWVRVNGVETPWCDDDLEALAGLQGVAGLVLPKVESLDELRAVGEGRRVRLIALIESAIAVGRLAELAAAPDVHRLAFGALDFAQDIDASDDDSALLFARSSIVVHSRAAGLPAPIDGVSTVIDDAGVVRAQATVSRRLGFGAKLCIHPAQIAPVRQAFAPADQEIAWAQRVLDAAGAGRGVAMVDGQMVDKPLWERAQAIVSRARR